MGSNDISIEQKEQPAPAQASYLRVNGSNNPQPLKIGSSEGSKTIEVETDGPNYSIHIPNNCIWITQTAKTNNYFVLFFTGNSTTDTRSSTIKVTSGTLTTDLAVSQEPGRAKPQEKPKQIQAPPKDNEKKASTTKHEPNKKEINIPPPPVNINPTLF